jgi:hypothetical protein
VWGHGDDVTRGTVVVGEGSRLHIIDMAGIQVCMVGGMRAGALDAGPAWVLCSSERKAEEVEEVGDDGWPHLAMGEKMEMNPHPYHDMRQGRGPSIGPTGWATSRGAAASV